MGTVRVAFPEDWADMAFSRREAKRRGITDARLRSRQLDKPFHGIRCGSGQASDLEGRCRAYFARPRPGQVIGGPMALALAGLPVASWRLGSARPLDIAVPASGHRPRSRDVAPVRMRDELWAEATIGGIPVLPPVTAWLMAARVLELEEAVVLGDALIADSDLYPGLRLRRPIATLEVLRASVEVFGRAPGSAMLRKALPLLASGSASPMESRVRFLIVGAGFPPPEPNARIEEDGALLGIADLAYRDRRTIVEYHGRQHRDDPDRYRRDIERRRRFLAAGWTVLELTAEDLDQGAWRLVRDLRRVLA